MRERADRIIQELLEDEEYTVEQLARILEIASMMLEEKADKFLSQASAKEVWKIQLPKNYVEKIKELREKKAEQSKTQSLESNIGIET